MEYSRGDNKEREDDIGDMPQVGADEGASPPKSELGLDASTIKDLVVAIKLAQSSIFPAGMEMVRTMELDEIATQFYHMHTQKRVTELKEEKENEKKNFDLAREKLEKKIAKLIGKAKEVVEAVEIAKMGVVVEFKASEEYREALTLEASRFYGEGSLANLDAFPLLTQKINIKPYLYLVSLLAEIYRRKVGIPISTSMTASVPYTSEYGVSLVGILIVV
ncbi:hypothetical protein Acr_00g0053150 [Actinidia rufa]|uniref:Uncharacterized protein n=1 Tax=Actinidia rufa TaxID=165716 RepID=A0A7J0DN82_9ERIC|nr:hypothetical protein Acr_00g0053150 [Actinidia rufa]